MFIIYSLLFSFSVQNLSLKLLLFATSFMSTCFWYVSATSKIILMFISHIYMYYGCNDRSVLWYVLLVNDIYLFKNMYITCVQIYSLLTDSTAISNPCLCVRACVSGRRCSGHAGTGSGVAGSPDGGEVDDAAAADGGGSTLAGAGGKLPGNFSLFSHCCVCSMFKGLYKLCLLFLCISFPK